MKNTYALYYVDTLGQQVARYDYETKKEAMAAYKHEAKRLKAKQEGEYVWDMPDATVEVCLYVNEDQAMLASTSRAQ